MSVSVSHEPPSQRLHYRLTAPAEVEIGGAWYHTIDWSMGGFRISGFGGAAREGDAMPVGFRLDYGGFAVSFRAEAEVIRRDDSILAAKFTVLGERETELIRELTAAVLSGQVSPVDRVLKRIDRPVTRTVIDPPREPVWAEQKRTGRRIAIAMFYITLAIGLACAASFVALQHVTILPLDSAATVVPQSAITTGEAGKIAEIYVNEGDRVSAGQPLFRIDSESAAKEIETMRSAVHTAEIELAQAVSRRDGEENKRRMYESISRDQLKIADARIRAIEVQRDLAEAELRRVAQLFEHGLTSRSLFDAQQAAVKEKDALLEQAQGERRIAESSVETTHAGLFFSGNYLVGDLTQLAAECKSAEERVKAAQAALTEALARETWRVYRSPFSGVVGAAMKPVGIAVERGSEVLLLRPPGTVYIDALLTPTEAAQVHTGMQGTGFVSATARTYALTVVSVDSRPQDSRTFARLALTGVSTDETNSIQPNLAVQVRLNKGLF